MMAETVCWFFVQFGLVYFIVQSALFAPVRVMIARRSRLALLLVYCPNCVGAWVGLGLVLAHRAPFVDDWSVWAQLVGLCGGMVCGELMKVWRWGLDSFRTERKLVLPGTLDAEGGLADKLEGE